MQFCVVYYQQSVFQLGACLPLLLFTASLKRPLLFVPLVLRDHIDISQLLLHTVGEHFRKLIQIVSHCTISLLQRSDSAGLGYQEILSIFVACRHIQQSGLKFEIYFLEHLSKLLLSILHFVAKSRVVVLQTQIDKLI